MKSTVSPDGKWIAFIADARLRSDSAVTARARLDRQASRRIASATSCRATTARSSSSRSPHASRAAPSARRARSSTPATRSNLEWSPDSKRIAFVGAPAQFKNRRLLVVDAAGGKPQDILGTWQYEPGNITWLNDGQIMMATSTGGSNGVYKIDPNTKKITTVLGGRRQVNGPLLDRAQQHIVFVETDLTHPTELYVANADGTNERKLTSFNDKLNSEIAWSDAERSSRKVASAAWRSRRG